MAVVGMELYIIVQCTRTLQKYSNASLAGNSPETCSLLRDDAHLVSNSSSLGLRAATIAAAAEIADDGIIMYIARMLHCFDRCQCRLSFTQTDIVKGMYLEVHVGLRHACALDKTPCYSLDALVSLPIHIRLDQNEPCASPSENMCFTQASWLGSFSSTRHME